MSSKQHLEEAVKRLKARQAEIAAEKKKLALRLENESLEFATLATSYIYNGNQGYEASQDSELQSAPGGVPVDLKFPLIRVLGHTIRLTPKLNDDQLYFTLDELGESERGFVVRKLGNDWNIVQISSGIPYSQFSAEYLISRLVHLIDSL